MDATIPKALGALAPVLMLPPSSCLCRPASVTDNCQPLRSSGGSMARISFIWLILTPYFALAAGAQSPLQHQKAANDALQSQVSKEGKDCLDAKDNYQDKVCISEVFRQTDKDFAVFYDNLKQLLDSTSGINLEQAQQHWLAYREKSCHAIDEFFRDGSARGGLATRCQIQLTRSRMKDLDSLYSLPLHH
jgi:uncharacterized protein YecT (DUF1311 family)